MAKYYLTTTLPYVNSSPHLGHALEYVQADVLARFHRILGEEVFFNTGTDEHGSKILEKAQESGRPVKDYVDEYAERFQKFIGALRISNDVFIRTTDPHHEAAAVEFWKRCSVKGDIEKRLYQAKYCRGCELEKTDSELEEGRCPLHPNLEIEVREEENYFFKFSNYQQPLLDLYESRPDFVLPENRLREVREFVASGARDFSISRLKSKMPWGIPVPGDPDHVMYVWFDALINYISTLQWPQNETNFRSWWPGSQIAGKDNLRQQAAMWQAMLLSANLPPSRQILIHGFITSNGTKMSKTVGNVVDPMDIMHTYGSEALRFWLTKEVPVFEDGDFTLYKFHEAYTAGLSNGLGNLVSRVLKMAADQDVKLAAAADPKEIRRREFLPNDYIKALSACDIRSGMEMIWQIVADCDAYIQKEEPFRKAKTDLDGAKKDLVYLLGRLLKISIMLEPYMPETANRILHALSDGKPMEKPLFPRIPAPASQ